MSQQQQQIQPFDWHRLLLGEAPAWFLIEIAVRMALIYLMLMVAMRLMGKRLAGQMSLSEIAIIVTLGAAVGVPMQAPERGILAPLILLGVAILFQRGLSIWSFKNRKVEVVAQGDVCVLLEDGRMLLDRLSTNMLSRERLFAMLRTQGIQQLGELRRVYLETSGDFSVIKRKDQRPGLSITPIVDEELRNNDISEPGMYACFSCGKTVRSDSRPEDKCSCCGTTRWTDAVLAVEA